MRNLNIFISNFTRLLGVLLLLSGAVTTTAQTTETGTKKKPNVVMIFTDDMGYADISSFADVPLKVKTPNIDRIGAEGLRLKQFYVNSPICSPSRAAVLPGR